MTRVGVVPQARPAWLFDDRWTDVIRIGIDAVAHSGHRAAAFSEIAPRRVVNVAGDLPTQNAIEQFLYRESRYLDDREFEKWLECYADDVVFWMPSWGDDDRLTQDPQRDISLIYYPNKGGLEDRVFRIRTERSSATSPRLSRPPGSR